LWNQLDECKKELEALKKKKVRKKTRVPKTAKDRAIRKKRRRGFLKATKRRAKFEL
jgi:hypothetical protein